MNRAPLGDLPDRVDIVIIGGGITGAGVFAAAAAQGRSVVLLEQADFASGTSSWSSKLVHGGLRYLKSGDWRLTLESVRERNRLLRDQPGLVIPQPFLMPVYAGQSPGLTTLRIGISIYDLMGGRGSRRLSAAETLAREPGLRPAGLRGAVTYEDASTDDVRLVLRTILSAAAADATARSYSRVTEVLQSRGRVCGVAVRDEIDGSGREIMARVVIDAAGVDAAALPGAPPGAPLLRPLRGSHLIFPLARLPLRHAVSWLHPVDRRPVFAYPWNGVLLLGTTDLDHPAGAPVRIELAEISYLLEALNHQFPDAGLSAADALCATSGLRPVVAGGKASPSAESRESAIWSSPGWIGVTGGKLTTFAATAQQVLQRAATELPETGTAPSASVRATRPGTVADATIGIDPSFDNSRIIAGTPYRLDQLSHSARHESVEHLDDLLMRRLRLSLLLPGGGVDRLAEFEPVIRDALQWDTRRWQQECVRYRTLWQAQHAVPLP